MTVETKWDAGAIVGVLPLIGRAYWIARAAEPGADRVGPDFTLAPPPRRGESGDPVMCYGLFIDPSTHRRHYTHRLAHALLRGPVRAGELTLHHCDVAGLGAGCLSPFHTFRGTGSDNLRDAAAKGLMRRKLSASQVLEIRALRQANTLSRAAIAERYGIDVDDVPSAFELRTERVTSWRGFQIATAVPRSARRLRVAEGQ